MKSGRCLVKFSGSHVSIPNAERIEATVAPPGDRARACILRHADRPGGVQATKMSLVTSSPVETKSRARAPTAKDISKISCNHRASLTQDMEVEGEWSKMNIFLRDHFIGNNLEHLQDGRPGVLAYWQSSDNFFVLVSKASALAQFTDSQHRLIGTDDKNDTNRDEAPVKAVIGIDLLTRKAFPIVLAFASASPAILNWLCADSLLRNRTCGPACSCVFQSLWQHTPEGPCYRTYRTCQTPPGASVPSVLSRQDCPGDALEHHVSYDMDAAAALGWATAGFGGTVCDFHHVKAQGAWFEKHGIPEFLQRAIDFGGHILLRAPTLDSQNTLRELLKTIIRAHLIPDAPTLGAPDDLCNQLCAYIDHHYGGPGSPWEFKIGDAAGKNVPGYFTTAAAMESHFNVSHGALFEESYVTKSECPLLLGLRQPLVGRVA